MVSGVDGGAAPARWRVGRPGTEEFNLALQAVRQGRATLVIAHRLSTIRSADRIVVLDDGRVVEQGTHDDVVARGSAYRSLIAAQTEAAHRVSTG